MHVVGNSIHLKQGCRVLAGKLSDELVHVIARAYPSSICLGKVRTVSFCQCNLGPVGRFLQ